MFPEIIPKKKLRKKKEKEDKESIPDQLQLLYFEDVNGLLIIKVHINKRQRKWKEKCCYTKVRQELKFY